jgi:hypothetical protein
MTPLNYMNTFDLWSSGEVYNHVERQVDMHTLRCWRPDWT